MAKGKALVKAEEIQRHIHQIRGQRVILDADLARFYGVNTKTLNQAVKRNHNRFPPDFLFPLKKQELVGLRSQNVTANISPKSRSIPYAFTEHGALMAATVLRSHKASQISVLIIRAFVALRDANQRLLDRIWAKLSQHDEEIAGLAQFLNSLLEMEQGKKKPLH